MAELIRSSVVQGIDPEAITEIGNLNDHRLDVERKEAKAVDDVLIGQVTKVSCGAM